MVGFLYRFRKYLIPTAMVYLYKSRIRSKMGYCYYRWVGVAQSSKAITWLCGRWIIFHYSKHFPQNETLIASHHSIAFSTAKRSIYPSSTISDIHWSVPLCHIHGIDSSPLYSISKKELPLWELLPQNCHFVEQTTEWMLSQPLQS